MIGYGSIMFNAIDFCMSYGVRLEMKPSTTVTGAMCLRMGNMDGTKAVERIVDLIDLQSMESWSMANHALKVQIMDMLKEIKGEEWYESNCNEHNWFRAHV